MSMIINPTTLEAFATRYGFQYYSPFGWGPETTERSVRNHDNKRTVSGYLTAVSDNRKIKLLRPSWSMRREMSPRFPDWSGGLKGVYEWLTYNHFYPSVEGIMSRRGMAGTAATRHLFCLNTISEKGEPTYRFGTRYHQRRNKKGIVFGFEIKPAHVPTVKLFVQGEMEATVFRDWLIDHDYLEQA